MSANGVLGVWGWGEGEFVAGGETGWLFGSDDRIVGSGDDGGELFCNEEAGT